MAADSKFVASEVEYNDIFEVFTRGRREQEKVWLENDVVPKLCEAFTQGKLTLQSTFKVLAVGSGKGSFDCLLLKTLFSHAKELIQGRQVIYTVVEPNAAAIDDFRNNVSTQDVFRNVKFNWVNKGMQEFFDADEPERYDFIHFVHVLYYVRNEEEILKSAYEKFLACPGCILAIVGNEGDIWVNLMESFKTKVQSLSSELHYPTNKELSEICKRSGWAFDTFSGKLDLEVTEIFIEGDPIGEAMIKFFLHINEDPKERFGEELISEVMEFFRRMSWESIADGRKCRFVNDDEGLLFIYKRT